MTPEIQTPSSTESIDDAAERLFVGLVLVAMTVALGYFVVTYGRNVPYYEDYELVPVLTGRRPFSISWLFEFTFVEHRTPIAKLLLYPLWLASGGDFRSSIFVDAAVLSGLAYACVRAARAVRGRAAFADALIPVVLLNWGHAENLLFFVQLFFLVPVVLTTTVLLLVATGRWERSPRATAALGLCILLMPLNGGVGMTLAPPLVVWAAYAGWRRWRSKEPTGLREGSMLAGAALVAVLLSALYFVGYSSDRRMTGTGVRTLRTVAQTTVETLCLSLGSAGRELWPWLGLACAVLFGATACVLAFLVEVRREERVRASGLLACLASVGLMLAAIGFGRAPVGPGAGMVDRYALLLAPAVVCAYLTAVLYGGPAVGRFVQALLFAGALALLGPNVRLGVEYAKFRTGPEDALAADIRAGMPPEVLGQRYTSKVYVGPETLGERLAMLRDAGLGPYKEIAASAPTAAASLREVPVPIEIVGSNQVAIENGAIRATGEDPYVVLALPEPRFVAGIRLTFTLTNGDGVPASTQVYWRRSGQNDFEESGRNVALTVPVGPAERTETVWTYDEIDGFRIDPDRRPCELRLARVVLLVPE